MIDEKHLDIWNNSSHKKCMDLRCRVLNLAFLGGDANLQSIFSALDIMWVIYDKLLSSHSTFVLSKGQATLGLYTILEEKKRVESHELDTYCKLNSPFGMQADRTKFKGEISISAGSLGHGLPIAVGMAMAEKIKKTNHQIYVLVGDGEFNEGTMWEAALLAGSKKLDNLCLIIDDNHSIGHMISMENMNEKLDSFGFQTIESNGHDFLQLLQALTIQRDGRPLAIIAHTIRGFGSETIMTDNSWFHRAPKQQELFQLLEEVKHFEKTNV